MEGGGAGGDLDLVNMWGCWGGGGGNIGGRIWVRVGTEESMQDLALHHKEYTFVTTTNRAFLNPILHTAWLNNHALTLKRNTAKYYFGEKSSVLHTFLKTCCDSRKI